jgi:DNA-binding response OmpR family regulator
MNNKKVLIIDDDSGFLYLTGLLFKKAGASVFTARDGLEGISQLFAHQPDLILLDVEMPGMDGFEVCKRIRQISETPIIFVTAINKEQEMLKGLEAGADDFLSKPFNPEILLARAAAVLRRSGRAESQAERLNFDNGHLVIDFERHEVLVEGRRIKITPTEFSLLTYLVRNAGKVLTFEQILTRVWGNQYGGSPEYVHVYISQLRNKIEENPKQPRYLLTIHGVGYVFEK